MMRLAISMVAVAISALAACPPPAPTPPGDDDYARACATLAALACPEAEDRPTCVSKMRDVQAARLTDLAPACVAAAHSVEDVRACAPSWRSGCRGKRSTP